MLKKIKNRYIKILSLTLLSLSFISCGESSSSSSGGDSSSFTVTLIDGYIGDANVSDANGTEANQSKTDFGKYTFPTAPAGELNASGGIFSESNITNYMLLKAPPLSRVISPITTLLVDYPSLNSTLQNALNVTEKQLVGNFLSADDLNIAKLAQMVYGIYVNDLSSRFANSLDGSSPASLDDIFNIAKDVVNVSSIVRKTDLLIFLEVVENYSGTTSALEVAIKDQKQKAQSDSSFEVSVIDGYISDARVSDIDGELADQNESKIGYYNFRVSPYGELNASGGVFSESNITNRMLLKAPPLSRVISPITTLLVDYPSLNSTLQNALNVTEEQLVGNFLSADDLNIAKLAQMVYGIYVTDSADDFNASLRINPPASLDDIFNIAKDIAKSKGNADLVIFLGAVESYSVGAEGLEDAIKEQKDAIASAVEFSLSVVDGYISGSLVEDNASNIAQENTTNLGEYIFSDTPFGVLSARGGVFVESNLSNLMSLKAPPLSRVISPITTLLLDFPALADELTVGLGVSEEELRSNFLESDDLNIAKLAQMVYGIYVNDLSNEFASLLDGSSPASLDDIFNIGKDVVNVSSIVRKTDLLTFLEVVENYNSTTSALEVAIKDQKQKAQSDSPFEVSVIDGYISDARVSDIDGKLAEHNESKIGYYNFRVSPYGELSASGGVFSESNLSNLMSLKAPPLSKVISPITTLLLDFSNLATILESALGVTNEQLVGNFLSADDLNIAKLDQMVYGIYVNELSNEFASLLDGSSPASLDDIFDIGKDVVNASSIVRKTDLLAFFDALENYNGTTSALEVAIKDQKQKAQSDSPFEVSVIDGYISDARVSDIDGKLAEHNESKIGYYNFRVSPYGELNASGGIFSESNITNHMVLKAPPLSRVISPITTLLLDFSNLATILESALGVTNEQLVGNFLSADDLNIAKLAQITYGMYVTDNADDFNASLSANPPASLDDIFDIAKDIANSKGDADLVAFLGAVESYSGSTGALEDNIKEQKDALTSNNPFSLSVVDGYISGSLVEDNASNRAQENITNLGEYIFSDTPFGVLSARGGVFVESNLSNLMSLKAPALSKVISPITTLLLDFPALADELTVGLGVSEEELRSNFLESDDLNIAKLAQMVYGIYVNDLSNEFASLLDGSSPASLDDIFNIAKDVVNVSSIVRKTDLLTFLEVVENYNSTTSALEVAIKDQKQKAQSDSPFEVSVIDGYISDARVSDIDDELADKNESKAGYYNFRVSPYGELSARGGVFVESNLSNLMSLKAPPLSRVISPITTLLLDFPALADELTVGLGVSEEKLRSNFLESDDLNIAKLAQMVYGIYVNDLSNEFASLLDGSSPASLDDIFNIGKDVVNVSSIVRKTDLLTFLEVVENYNSTTSALEVAIKDQKQKAQSDSPFEVSVIDGYISDARVSDIDDELADKNESKAGYYNFRVSPYGELSASGGVFSESNLSNLMSLKAPPLSKVISPITTLLLDFSNLATILESALGVTNEQLVGNFLESDDLNIAKLAQMVYGIYVNDLSNEFASLLDGSSPASLDDIFDIGKDVVNARSIVRKTDLLAFFDALENYNGTTSALEVAIKDQKQKAQSDSPFEVSVIDGYISDARVSDANGTKANQSKTDLGKYTFPTSPAGELNASGGIFSESNITNHMLLKAPPLSRVISPITTLLVDYPSLNSTLQNALNVTEEQLVGNFLSADDLNIAKLAQITYGMYVTDNVDDFNASLSANPPASLDDIFDIAKDIANSKGDADLVAFLGAVESYSGSTGALEDNIKEQKDALTSNNPFSLSVVDGYISGSLVEDNASNRAQENITNLGEYIFSDTPFGVLSARGGVFVESNLSNLMSLKAPALSKVISPITTLLLDFPALADELTVGLGVSEEELRSNFLESDDLNIAKLAQMVYISYVIGAIYDLNISLTNNPPSNLDELIENIALVVDEASITYQTRIDTALFLDKVKTYDGNTDELEAFISPYKAAVQNEGPSLVDYWAKTYGSSGNDKSSVIIKTSDGGYVFGGCLGDSKNCASWVLKLDSSGNILWQKKYERADSSGDLVKSILQKDSGNLLILGEGGQYFWILELNEADGSINFQKSYEAEYKPLETTFDMSSILKTSDGGYVIIGTQLGYHHLRPYNDDRKDWVLVVRVDANMDIKWIKNIRNIALPKKTFEIVYKRGNLYANDAFVTKDGGFLVVGTSVGVKGSSHHQAMALKLNSNGEQEWLKTYSEGKTSDEYAGLQLDDGNYVIAGKTVSKTAMYVMKINLDGEIIWQKAYGDAKSNLAEAYGITKSSDGRLIVVGEGNNGVDSLRRDIWVLKLNEQSGDIEEEKGYGGALAGNSKGLSVVEADYGGYVVVGETDSFGAGETDVWILKLNNLLDVPLNPASGAYRFKPYILYKDTASTLDSVTTMIEDKGITVVGEEYLTELNSTDTYIVPSSQSNGGW